MVIVRKERLILTSLNWDHHSIFYISVNLNLTSYQKDQTLDTILTTYSNSIKRYSSRLSEKDLDYWIKGLTISTLNPKQFYIHANTLQKEIGYVHSGLLRAFYIDDKGHEITVNFVREKNYATYCTSLENPQPSKYNFQCIEPSIIINVPFNHIHDCINRFPELERYIRIAVEDIHRNMLIRMEGFLFDNAETRYLNFISLYPDLYNRVSLSDLCTFLGIERQSLTRIRKKIAQQTL